MTSNPRRHYPPRKPTRAEIKATAEYWAIGSGRRRLTIAEMIEQQEREWEMDKQIWDGMDVGDPLDDLQNG